MGWERGIAVQSSAGARDLSPLQIVQTGSEALPVSYSMGDRRIFLGCGGGGKVAEA